MNNKNDIICINSKKRTVKIKVIVAVMFITIFCLKYLNSVHTYAYTAGIITSIMVSIVVDSIYEFNVLKRLESFKVGDKNG